MTQGYAKAPTFTRTTRQSQEFLIKQEIFDAMCDGTSSLSELSSDSEGEEKDLITAAQLEFDVNHPFTLELDTKFMRIDKRLVTDKMKDHSREISFKGSYKHLDIMFTCVVPSINDSYFDDMNRYEWKMSDCLLPCRSMATCISHFRSKRNAVLNEIIGDTSDQAVWFFIKPYHEKGTLANYRLSKRRQGTHIEPLYILQIAISLFSALKDAHALGIGLVSVSMDSLWLGLDGVVYFNEFKSCVYLQQDNEQLPWVDFDLLDCPDIEKKRTKEQGYSAETDVFQASLIVLSLMQKCQSKLTKLVVMGEHQVDILRNQIDPLYTSILPAVEPGLAFKGEERPTASAMLQCFESMRYRALA
ncbi:hypothetical protein MAM1_0005d00595 [Mucor ambiguus]|uniref:Protein kinase domain-containing protein n=1 Tax=Mucor ambiguus TaxID=91626 RepID=A0A0C9M4F5_9FUNG|nr:hypothetical protein MAM1_0005d00595 [Mucor ambiguus]